MAERISTFVAHGQSVMFKIVMERIVAWPPPPPTSNTKFMEPLKVVLVVVVTAPYLWGNGCHSLMMVGKQDFFMILSLVIAAHGRSWLEDV